MYHLCYNFNYKFIIERMNKKITERLLKFRDDRDWKQFHSPENLAKSVSIEAAEVLECFQWSSEFKKEELVEELADVFIYATLLAEAIDVDPEEIVMRKIDKNEKKYPVSKSKGNSTKYTKL